MLGQAVPDAVVVHEDLCVRDRNLVFPWQTTASSVTEYESSVSGSNVRKWWLGCKQAL